MQSSVPGKGRVTQVEDRQRAVRWARLFQFLQDRHFPFHLIDPDQDLYGAVELLVIHGAYRSCERWPYHGGDDDGDVPQSLPNCAVEEKRL